MTQAVVPSGVALAPGEHAHIGESFMYSTIAFYLHTELALTDRRFIASRPNTLLGLIRVGTSRSSYPIENVAGVSAGTRFDILGIIFGGFALLVGLGGLGLGSAGGGGGLGLLSVLLIAIGASSVINAPKQWVEVMNSGGGAVRFPVSVFERGRTLEFAGRVSETMARAPRGQLGAASNLRESSTSGTPSPSPSDALQQLESLRVQGLVTEDEFASKRRDIIDRL